MTNDNLRTRYADLLDGDPDLSGVISRLDLAYRQPRPPKAFVDATCDLLLTRADDRGSVRRLTAWWQTLWSTQRALAVVVAAAMLLVLAGAVGYASTRIIRVANPQHPGPMSQVTGFSDMPGMPFVRYRGINPARAAAQSGLPIAYLATVPPVLRGTVGTRVYPNMPWVKTNTKVETKIHSIVRYRGHGHTLLIELSEPSPAVIAKYRILLGEHAVHLPNGTPAWTSFQINMFQPNVVSFVSGNYIVSAASDLPMSIAERLAARISVSKPSAHPAGIPSTWPTPLPAATIVLGVDLVMDGTAEHYVTANGQTKMQIDVQYGNRAMEPYRNQVVTFILPPGIRFAHRTPADRWAFHAGGDGEIRITDEKIVVSNPRAFDRGLTVRVTWTQRGVPGEKTFHFPIVAGPAPTPIPLQPTPAP